MHFSVAAGLAGKSKARPRAGGPVGGPFRGADPEGPAADPRRPEHRQGRSRQLPDQPLASPAAGRASVWAVGAARTPPDSAPQRRARVWPAVERSRLRFRHSVIPLRLAWHYDCLRLCAAICARARARSHHPSQEESTQPMPRTRQQNVTAAQWSANGSRTRLTRPDTAEQPGLRGQRVLPFRPAPPTAQARLQGAAAHVRARRGARHDDRRLRSPRR